MNILEAIAERERQLAEWRPRKELEAELDQLNAVVALIGPGVRPKGEARTKPPPRTVKARKEKPVRAEKATPPTSAPRPCKGCRKPIPPRTDGRPGRQKQWHPECLAASKRSPKTKAEPDPVGKAPLFIETPAGQRTVAAINKGMAPEKPAPFAKAAAAWAGQCPMLDSETGKRCSLPKQHEGLHSGGGRQFSNAAALNLVAMGGRA